MPKIALRDNRYLSRRAPSCRPGPACMKMRRAFHGRLRPAAGRTPLSEESGMAACAPTMEMETEAAGA